MPKVTKKASKSGGRVAYADLPQGERDTMAKGLIDELYSGKLPSDEKSKRRQRLRTIDANWMESYGSYIERNGYGKREKAAKKKVVKKKASKKAARTTSSDPAPAEAAA